MELLTFEEAAEYLRMSKRSLQRKVKKGEIKCVNVSSRLKRILRSDLDDYIAKQRK